MVMEQVKCGYSLASEIPNGTPGFLSKIMKNCWNIQDHQRPYFPQIIAELLPSTSPCFTEHFRMVSFYHTKEGAEYRKYLKTVLDGEDDNEFTMSLTTTSVLGICNNDDQPPPLPERPFLGLKWPTSLSFRGISGTGAVKEPLETTVSTTVEAMAICHQSALEKNTDDEASLSMPEEIAEFSSCVNISASKKMELAGSTSGLTDTEISSGFKDVAVSRELISGFQNSSSELRSTSESTSKQVRPMDGISPASGSDIVIKINSRGAPFSALALSETPKSSSLGKLPKTLKNVRSMSTPNIEAAAC
ncbi:hypothetical protein SK128_008905 [Halocaridina rubra]|uniref:Serine-threonine/tyrosine-protein kinase catalytic domain-containing protein n=1 Tax=Halocaridina rubra TaxID=373956 RepID=A0AAN8XBX3_HALRR